MSTPDDCERWAELSDRKMLDESLSDEDARFFEEHQKTCALCAAEANAWAGLAELPDEPSLPEAEAEALVERVLAATEAKKLPLEKKLPLDKKLPLVSLDERRKRRNLALGAVAAALALAAGVLLLLRGSQPGPSGPSASLVEASGDVRVGGQPVTAGTKIPGGARVSVGRGAHACLSFDEGKVKSCLGAGSELTLTRVDAADRELSLTEGTVVTALDKLPAGQHFSVTTAKGRATVTGTVFSVTLPKGEGSLVVRVHEGSVEVGGGRAVTSGQELDVTRGAERLVDPNVRDQELRLVGVTLPRHAAAAPMPSASVRAVEPAPLPPSASAEVAAKPPSASEMLSLARAQRAQGNAAGAAEGYRRLMAVHPKSAEARAALLSLAELQLGPLGDPAGALRSYDAYLRSGGGGLSQEAQYGRIQALRRLGRAAEERAAIEAFVKAYPNSVQARALKSRIEGSAP